MTILLFESNYKPNDRSECFSETANNGPHIFSFVLVKKYQHRMDLMNNKMVMSAIAGGAVYAALEFFKPSQTHNSDGSPKIGYTHPIAVSVAVAILAMVVQNMNKEGLGIGSKPLSGVNNILKAEDFYN